MEFLNSKNKIRLDIKYKNNIIRFGTISILRDNSIVFASSILNNLELYKNLDINSDGKQWIKQKNSGDIHATLHPQKQLAHIKAQKTNTDLLVKRVQWFPVLDPFVFLVITTPPLNKCPSINKHHSSAKVLINASYCYSLEFIIYILPYTHEGLPRLNTKEKPFILGVRKPHFQIYLSCRKLYRKLNAAIVWRNGDWFIN